MNRPQNKPDPGKNRLGQRVTSAILFGYAVIVGTSTPVFLSRCSGSCLGCGSCALFLGILPLALVVAMKSRLGRLLKQATSKLGRLV